MFIKNIEQAIEILEENKLLIYPTETFFGLGCKISSEKAIADIFKTKKRLLAMPLPVIIADFAQMARVSHMSPEIFADVEVLAEHFWPGPITLILRARANISPLLTGGTGNIALRQSSHPIALALTKAINEPLISSSANISGVAPVTKASDLDESLVKSVAAVLDLPPAPNGGLSSTIVEPFGNKKIALHRQGSIALSKLQELGFTV